MKPSYFIGVIAGAALCLSSCLPKPVILPDPFQSLNAAGSPIDAFTTGTAAGLSFSYLELPGPSNAAVASGTTAAKFPFETKAMPLSQVIAVLLENDLSIKISDISRKAADDKIMAEKGIYDLMISASSSWSAGRRQQAITPADVKGSLDKVDPGAIKLPVSHSRNDEYTGGLSQLIDTGGQFSLRARATRDYFYSTPIFPNPSYEQDWVGRFDQPLLKRFGPDVTNAAIHIAKNDKKIAQQDWRLTLMDEVGGVEKVYWDLIFAVNNARVTELSLRQAQSLLDQTQKKVAVGLLPNIEALRQESEVAARQDQLIINTQQINNIQDDLKRRLRIKPGHEMWNVTILPTETPMIKEIGADVKTCLTDAYNRRPEILKMKTQADTLSQQEMINRNAMLPDLTAFFSYGLTGMAETYNKSQRISTNGEHKNWATGLEFSFPLQNRKARGDLAFTRKQIDQLKLSYQAQLEGIAMEVRVAVRSVETARKRIETTRTQIEFEAAKLDAEIKRYENGISTSQFVLDYQRDLAVARANYLSAMVTYNQAIISLDQARGVILERNNISEAEAETSPAPYFPQ